MTDEDFVLHGLVISLHARLDTIERKLDWLHGYYEMAERNPLLGEWPGDLPESKP